MTDDVPESEDTLEDEGGELTPSWMSEMRTDIRELKELAVANADLTMQVVDRLPPGQTPVIQDAKEELREALGEIQEEKTLQKLNEPVGRRKRLFTKGRQSK